MSPNSPEQPAIADESVGAELIWMVDRDLTRPVVVGFDCSLNCLDIDEYPNPTWSRDHRAVRMRSLN